MQNASMAWQNLNEYVLLKIYELLSTKDRREAGQFKPSMKSKFVLPVVPKIH